MTTTDLIIIGAGPGGYHTAGYAVKHGLQVVIIEKGELGGTCLNVGCIPTKSFAHDADLYRNPLVPKSENGIDFKPILERKNQVVAQLVSGIATLLSQPGITLVKGEAHFVDAHTVEVEGEQYTAKNILIATGSQSKILPFMHDNPHIGSNVMTSTELLNMDFVPRRLCLIGAGVIGMEFASFFNSMGVKVSVVEMMPEILGAMDKETAGMLRSEYLKRGVNFYLGTKVTAVSHEGVTVEKDGKASLIEAGKILVSVGRKANLGQAGLDKLNVELLRNGVKVDEHMQTSHPRVYACGDITGRSMLAHTAIRESEVAVNHILGVEDAMNYDCIPGVVYTNPEVAGVGKTEEELKALGTGYHIQKLPMAYSGRFVAENELGNGLCKLVLDDGDRIIGCHLLGNPASEIIVAAGIAVQHGYTVEEFQKSVFPHPTVGEIFHETLFA